MPASRSLPLLVAVVLLGLLGLAGLLVAPLLLVEAAAADGTNDSLGDIASAALSLIALASGLVGALSVVSAVGIWRARAWGWAIGAIVTALVLVGTLVGWASAGPDPALVTGAATSATALAGVWAPSTRRACGV
jgi:hypothetical protein